MGPCMCGDPCCNSCGPAQGNWRCPLCRNWVYFSEGCDHFDESGNVLPEFAEAMKQKEFEREEAEAAVADEYLQWTEQQAADRCHEEV